MDTTKSEYNSLDQLLDFVSKESPYQCSKEYDIWNVRTDTNGQMEKCVFIKKSAMHGMKIYSPKENVLEMKYIIPNKLMNAYFGESQKRYQNVLEIITGKIKKTLLSNSQEKAFKEMGQVFNKITIQ